MYLNRLKKHQELWACTVKPLALALGLQSLWGNIQELYFSLLTLQKLFITVGPAGSLLNSHVHHYQGVTIIQLNSLTYLLCRYLTLCSNFIWGKKKKLYVFYIYNKI